MIARVWQGRTSESVAETYMRYMCEYLLELPRQVKHFDILVDE